MQGSASPPTAAAHRLDASLAGLAPVLAGWHAVLGVDCARGTTGACGEREGERPRLETAHTKSQLFVDGRQAYPVLSAAEAALSAGGGSGSAHGRACCGCPRKAAEQPPGGPPIWAACVLVGETGQGLHNVPITLPAALLRQGWGCTCTSAGGRPASCSAACIPGMLVAASMPAASSTAPQA